MIYREGQAMVEQIEAVESVKAVESVESVGAIELVIYVAPHCPVCQYAYEVAGDIRERFPDVCLRIVDVETTDEEIPERVFATPTYLLNGRVWSLGNPSPSKVTETLSRLEYS